MVYPAEPSEPISEVEPVSSSSYTTKYIYT
jgi:hypothetical protein